MSENNQNLENQNQQQSGNQQQPTFDYDKLATLITGKQSVTEDTVLKSYFKEQGLSSDEMKQAISAFKAEKAKNTPDVSKLQSDITTANNARLQAEINQHATLEAVKLGVDIKSIPYVIKMADFSNVATDGSISTDKVTEAVKKVIEDIPALKGGNVSGDENQNNGFQKIGGDGGNENKATDDMLRDIFGIKKN